MVALDNTILNVAVPSISHEFGASESDLQWVTTAYGLVLADCCSRGGVRRSSWTKGMLLAGLAISDWRPRGVVRRVDDAAGRRPRADGVGGACTMPATLAVLGNVFAASERGQAIAIWSSVAGIAAGAGPIVGGVCCTALVGLRADRESAGRRRRVRRRWCLRAAIERSGLTSPRPSQLARVVGGVDRGSRGHHRRSGARVAGAFDDRRSECGGRVLRGVPVQRGALARSAVDAETARDPRVIAGAVTMAGLFFAMFGVQFVLTQWIHGDQAGRRWSQGSASFRMRRRRSCARC